MLLTTLLSYVGGDIPSLMGLFFQPAPYPIIIPFYPTMRCVSTRLYDRSPEEAV